MPETMPEANGRNVVEAFNQELPNEDSWSGDVILINGRQWKNTSWFFFPFLHLYRPCVFTWWYHFPAHKDISGQGCTQCRDGSNRLFRWESYGNTMKITYVEWQVANPLSQTSQWCSLFSRFCTENWEDLPLSKFPRSKLFLWSGADRGDKSSGGCPSNLGGNGNGWIAIDIYDIWCLC